MTDVRLLTRLWTPSVRKRIFGGFSVILLLLAVLAWVALHGMAAAGAGAARVSDNSAQATASAEVALLVGEARALVVQYALTATMDDQKAAQAGLTRLDQTIERNRSTGSASGSALQAVAGRYRSAVNDAIGAVEARRSTIEQMEAAATDLHTIVSAATQMLERETDLGVTKAVAQLAESFGSADSASARFVASRTPAAANMAAGASQALRTAIEALAAVSGDNRRMQRFVKGMADPLDRFTKAVPLLVAADERLRTATAEREAAATAVLQAAADQQVRAAEAQRQAIAAMLADTGSARRLSLLTSASAIGLGLLLAVLIGRGIARPITELTRVMHRLAGGALDVDIPNAKRSDELGEMARAVVVFKDNAASVQRLQREQEADRHQAEMEKRAALETMADTIETDTAAALGLIRGRTTAMTAMADAMRESAVRTGAAAVTASRAAAQALANAQSVAGAAEQLSASIQEIGSQVDQSTAVVGRAVTAGTETRSTIEALNQEVEQIGAVADIIGEIAAKTNLLALNATIEAARAGDAGKGFAVVASEVKALANQTARSTQEIARHINQVRTATGASVAAVARIEETITEVNAIAGSIAAAVEQQGAATAEIARSVGETAAVANEMTMRTAEVSSEASETGRQAAEVRDNSASLGDAMEELRQSVTRVVRNSTVEVDRRGSERRTVDLPCQLTIDGQTYRARVVDLSQSGAQVQGAPALQAGLRGMLAVDGVRDALPFVVSRSVNGALGLVFTLDAASAVRFGATLAQLGHTRAA
jgi:methyl-accepting chemotaxis protein